MESGRVSATDVLVEKKIRNPRAVGRLSHELTVTRNARRILPEKTKGISGGWYRVHFA